MPKTIYLNPNARAHAKEEYRLSHLERLRAESRRLYGEDTEIIESGAFSMEWVHNSEAVQSILRENGREDLVRPLE